MYYVYTVLNSLPNLEIDSFTNSWVYRNALNESIRFLPLYLFSVYYSLYVILPQYNRKQNFLLLMFNVLFVVIISFVAGHFMAESFLKSSGGPWTQGDVVSLILRKCFRELVIVTGTAVIIKMILAYSLRQQENETLIKKNLMNKLQLLKVQMHPHILFECLNHISDDLDAGVKDAPEMILKLSNLLSYLLYEGQGSRVTLDKEVKMIQDYIDLKKLEYKQKLDVHWEINGKTTTHYVTPGLFLPLLEIGLISCEMLEEPPLLLSLELTASSSGVYFYLRNNVPGNKIIHMSFVRSTMDNIQKRLQSLYLHKHTLEVYSGEDDFHIRLQIDQHNDLNTENRDIQNDEKMIYESA
ncbi:MAG TPA: histidine kinase [Puia sp.]